MRLATLLQRVDVRDVQGDLDRLVRGVGRDSRTVGAGGVFVAIRGARVDGHDLIGGLHEAAAVVVERAVRAPPGVTVVRVDDTKAALAALAAAWNGFPAERMKVIGVTGTNGKTTITTLVEEALLGMGVPAGRIGTTGIRVNGEALPSALTTPEAPELQAALAQMREAGVRAVLIEASSIGQVQRRLDQIPFHLGVFTNLTRDHLDHHGTMAAYRDAKAGLFQRLRAPGGPPRALLFGDDPAWPGLGPPADHWLYGEGEGHALRLVAWRADAQGLALEVNTPHGAGTLRSPLVGHYNALNLVAALGCLLTLDVPLSDALAALGAVRGVPGRLERVDHPGGPLVLVDYAHTPDALTGVLDAVRGATRGRLFVVFGCGGDRDAGKRPEMGRAAEAGADVVVVTSDNPRSEDPQAIVDATLSGMDSPPAHVALDRAAAIGWALAAAGPDDAVLIAGKGHETTQEIGGVKHPFDDRAVARAWLEGR